MSIHTWPEFGYAAVDVFGCGDKKKVNDACKILADFLKPARLVTKKVKRGM
jgi:S-adenosylmethionine/arginine decarboxylase-like enzyme